MEFAGIHRASQELAVSRRNGTAKHLRPTTVSIAMRGGLSVAEVQQATLHKPGAVKGVVTNDFYNKVGDVSGGEMQSARVV